MRTNNTICLIIKELDMKNRVVFFFVFFCFAPLTWANNPTQYTNDNLPFEQLTATDTAKNSIDDTLKSLSLASLYIELVVSSTVPNGEEIQKDQFQTKKHHGGSELLISTVEIGFGTDPIVIMSGRVLPETSLVRKDRLCKKRDGSVGTCGRGESLVGYRRVWDCAGYGNGEFSLQITSKDYPHNTLMAKLYIQ